MILADRYRLDAPLGRGAMGEVWRAWDLRLSRPVAVKMLAAAASDGDAAAARFRHEARTAARLNHPRVVGVYDFGTENGRSFLVMEWVCGRTLAQELRDEGPLALARIAEIGAQTAAGLAAAHLHGVVHRDVKPANLLAGEGGAVKIADFGIAQGDDGETTLASTRPDAVLGTSCYLSPERARGARADSAADVYALGCSLYELLTGRPPFTGDHPLVVLRRQVEDAPVPPRHLRPDTPEELNAYLLRMLRKEPQLRPTAAATAAWFAEHTWQSEQPDAARRVAAAPAGLRPAPPRAAAPVPLGAPTRRPRSRRTAPAAGAVTATAALAVAVLALASPAADSNTPTPPAHSPSRHDGGATARSVPASASPARAGAPRHWREDPRSGSTPAKAPSGTATTPAAVRASTASSAVTVSAAPAAPSAPAPTSAAPPSSGATTPPPTTPDTGPTSTTPPPTTPGTAARQTSAGRP
ncbi:serine/threonine-protein kinase [Actinacidiphila rubida]|uniref:serine/threonine-protein kinase n=2 Tax=Actinacidiphila rubida TaxID=310780 RepID=UPI0015A628B7|nr:serine/threonine-protein kinase [Actinacidiphila rubida]